MKALIVGDHFIPSKLLKKSLYLIKEKLSEIREIEFNMGKGADVRNKVINIETKGSLAYSPPEKLEKLLKDADILVVNYCPVPKKVVKSSKKLKIIATTRGGMENIDLETAREKRITVLNTPEHNAEAVAEYTIGLMLAELRNIARAHYSLKSGVWQENYPNSDYIPEINSLVIGLLGFGTIGKLVAEKLKCFKCKIMVYDPYIDNSVIKEAGCKLSDFKTILSESDIISLHVRLSEETENLIDLNELRIMKSTAYLINTARAGLVNTSSLYMALKNKWIKGAAIDVFDKEPIDPNNPLIYLDNITLTNHRAGNTRDAYAKAPFILAKKLKSFFDRSPDL
jgi:D-3-phosphoglycerate dehydrogenase / 2-oxoglutarate reductase